jgi:hypothetical protein
MFRYIRLQDGNPFPEVGDLKPFKAILILDGPVTLDWQKLASMWLVKSGCLYMMAWGVDCGSWDDSVDYANLEIFDFGEVPEDQAVMTTWHEDQELSEVFEFAKEQAHHSSIDLNNVLIVHVGNEDKRVELEELFGSV